MGSQGEKAISRKAVSATSNGSQLTRREADLGEMQRIADEAWKSSRQSLAVARAWIHSGTVLTFVAAISAFVAGYGGLSAWVGTDGVTAWSFTAGIIGTVSGVLKVLSDKYGVAERLRSSALRHLSENISFTIERYEEAHSDLVNGHADEFADISELNKWLKKICDEFRTQRQSLAGSKKYEPAEMAQRTQLEAGPHVHRPPGIPGPIWPGP